MKRILITIALIFFAASLPVTASAQENTCGDTYTVQPDDWLYQIARTCNTTLSQLLAANPEIEDPSVIFPGQVLSIPQENEAPARAVSISPRSGPPGTFVTVFLSGYPENTPVEIGVGRFRSEFDVVGEGVTNELGRLQTQVQIPVIANVNERWVVVAQTQTGGPRLRERSNTFAVTENYVVQSGDILSRLALDFNTTISALVQANPEIIEDPSLIYPGERIEIPGTQVAKPRVTISPLSGGPGATVNVLASGFPALTSVQVSIGPQNGDMTVLRNMTTNRNGVLRTQVSLPITAEQGQRWGVTVQTTGGKSISATSNIFQVMAPE